MTEILSVKDLTYTYNAGMPGSKPAISGMNISFNKGDFVGIIGHTGSGKSTLLQHFNGLFKPTSGSVFVKGEDIWAKKYDLRKARNTVGLVFQYPEYQLFEETVYKDIAFGPKNMKLSEQEIDARVREAAELVGVTDLLDKSPFDLSGGQKRRVAVAGVFAMEPEVLVLDEPAAGLDPQGKDDIFSCISRFHEFSHSTVIVVSHSMDDIARYVSRVVVINDGHIFLDGSVADVFARADEITEMGLSVPTVTKVLFELNKINPDISTSIFDIESAADNIAEAIRKADAK